MTENETFARRRAMSGRLRGTAHLVRRTATHHYLSRKAICGFQPKWYWSANEAFAWEETCERCVAVAADWARQERSAAR